MITLEQAKQLSIGQTIYTVGYFNANGSRQRWRVNGKVKIWKRNPNRVQVPLKHRLYDYGYLTEDNRTELSLFDNEPTPFFSVPDGAIFKFTDDSTFYVKISSDTYRYLHDDADVYNAVSSATQTSPCIIY